jgi:hypothetical protein
MQEGIEITPNSREVLRALESEGKYLFHGSPSGDIDVLEPRQGQDASNSENPEEMVDDGDPAISASPYADIAIFRSIINKTNISTDCTSMFGRRNGELEFSVSSEKVLEEAKTKKGFVYVFNRADFEPYSRNGEASEQSMEWRCHKTVSPVQVIEVNSGDLPEKEKISILKTDEK